MTQQERTNLEKDVIYDAVKAEQEYNAHKVQLEIIGERLERLGKALQVMPEEVNPLPEPNSTHDFRDELNELDSRQRIVDMCRELRDLQQRVKATNLRKSLLPR